MSASESFPASSSSLFTKDVLEGPVTTLHLRRSRIVHGLLCVLGALPWYIDAPTSFQAAGWGLWLPGAGFLSVGGTSLLYFPLTLLLFGLAFFAWFGSGMIIAPVMVWIVSAAVAGLVAGPATAPYAPYLVPSLTIAWLAWSAWRRRQRLQTGRNKRDRRNAYLPSELLEIARVAAPAPPLTERALSNEYLGMLRYALDRALQPVGKLEGFDRIDQFQTAALRYQLNQLGYLLAMVQRHYTPNFHGYLSEAQRRVIEQSLQRQVWGYWRWENAWGNLNPNFDPAKKDNIMLTGYLNINTLLYMNGTGDDRYSKPGGLSFQYNQQRRFAHDVHSINASLLDNFRGQVYSQPYCLFPCEPNWIYPACNFRGLTSVTLHDTVFGTHFVDEIRDTFRHRLEEEFINVDGGLVALRSKLTGHALPFPVPDALMVKMLAPLFPDLARRYWAITRQEALSEDRKRIKLVGKGVDFGNYRSGQLYSIDAILSAAREMGDHEIAELALREIAEHVPRIERDGVIHFKASNFANLTCIESHIGIADGWREAICTKPPESVTQGPILTGAQYPDVLVARAVSDGHRLNLLLHPGARPGSQQILTIERLRPGLRHRIEGAVAHEASADSWGKLSVEVQLTGPSAISIYPAA